MKKRVAAILLPLLLLTASLAGMPLLSADMGPKPITWITVRGIGEAYDFDLLVEFEADDPDIVPLDLLDEDNIRNYYQDSYPITPLNGYQDADGFASYTLYYGWIPHYMSEEETDVEGERIFRIGYFRPPTVFKIALWTESGTLVVSPVVQTTMFYSYVTYDLSEDSVLLEGEAEPEWNDPVAIAAGDVYVETPVAEILGDFFLRMGLTVALELGILLAFGYRSKKSLLLVLWVNLATQSLLMGLLVAGNYWLGGSLGAWALLGLGELPVVGAEIALYVRGLKEKTRRLAVIYALTANLLSFALSFWSVAWLLG